MKVKCDSSDRRNTLCKACSHFAAHDRSVFCQGDQCMNRSIPAKCAKLRKAKK